MVLNDDPLSQEEPNAAVQSAAAPSSEESSPHIVNMTLNSHPTSSASPAPSGSSGVPDLTRTDSTPSSDRISLRSHVSIPVVGTFPLGSLRIHKMDSPRLPPPTSAARENTTKPEDCVRDDDMPPLEDDDNQALVTKAEQGGDAFVLLDLPLNSTVGCDAKAIGTSSSSAFQGFRNIPSGAHFVWISEPNAMSRCGYWFVTRTESQLVRVKQWDKFNEVLAAPASNFEARDYTANVVSLYPQLVPYAEILASSGESGEGRLQSAKRVPGQISNPQDDDTSRLWRHLTSCITEPLLARVTGKAAAEAGEFLVDTSDGAAGEFPQACDKKRSTPLYQTLIGAGELHFLFPEDDVDLAAIQQHGEPDTTADILRLLETPGTSVGFSDLLGEMQFAFLTGLHLANLSCVEQWWHLVLKVMLRAHALVLERPGLCCKFFEVLRAQMEYNEKYVVGTGSAGDEEDIAVREEYGGGGTGATMSVLDVVPGKKQRLREALTLYKRRMNEMLLERVDVEEGDAFKGKIKKAGAAFKELEAWFWRVGWDLRSDWVGKGHMEDEERDEYENDEYRPVIVDLDEEGREVGLVSFH